MTNSLSIRSYSKQTVGHTHAFHQLVLPLRGVINIAVGNVNGKVAPGECVVIREGCEHHFTAEEEARFVVADLHTLPGNLSNDAASVFSVTKPMSDLLTFIASQLEYRVSEAVESAMMTTFMAVLSEQTQGVSLDARIRNVVEYIDDHLQTTLDIEHLAKIACISPTQFKKQFRQQLGKPPAQYITALRMEKAKALLIHTDMPMMHIAEAVGYTDFSAFSRRFTQFYGLPPSKILQ